MNRPPRGAERHGEMGPEDNAVMLNRAGTTGNPEGETLTHRNLISNTIQCAGYLAMDANAQVVLVTMEPGFLPLFNFLRKAPTYQMVCS
ncbi:hypothetical protein I9X38_18550 [Bacillus mojavensis]|nr:hypothetical protein I9X38_18550 [Bacillus mojavensis]